MPAQVPKTKKTHLERSAPVTREYTIHLHKHIKGDSFKTRAPRAIKAIREFAQRAMFTSDVRIDTSVNGFVYKQGVRSVPHRVRVRLSRRRISEDKDDKQSKSYTLVSLVDVSDVKGLVTVEVADE